MTIPRLQQIQQMLKNEPDDSFLNYALALEYARINDLNKAIALIEELLVRDENYLGAYHQLGKYYELTDFRKKAIAIYNKGLVVALRKNDKKTLRELNEALMLLED